MLRLKHERLNAKRTQKDIADIVGISRPTLVKLENDEEYAMSSSYKNLLKLSEVYNLPIDELLKEVTL